MTLPPLLAPGGYSLLLALCDPKCEVFDELEDKIGFSIDAAGSMLMDLNDDRRGCIEMLLPWRQEVLP